MTTKQDYRTPSAGLAISEHKGKAFYEAKFRHQGKQVRRRIGPAWLDRSATGEWVPRKGRPTDGMFDVRTATIAAAGLVDRYITGTEAAERVERERRERGVTFREVAHGYLVWLERVRGAKPSTLNDHRLLLSEPGAPARRGPGTLRGSIMAAIGDRPAATIKTKHVGDLLASIAETRVSARTVNKSRALISAIFNFGMRESSGFGLTSNPAKATDKRHEPHPGVLEFYSREDVEEIAVAFEAEARQARDTDPMLDAEMVRISAYAGLRLGELLALRWSDIDIDGRKIIVSRAMSAGVESSTKSGKDREVPLTRRAVAALDRIKGRPNFVSADDLVCASIIGRHLDGSALRRRYRRAQAAAGVNPLRWHDLRHTFGSLLVAGGMDLVSVRDAMGHSDLATTGRYLHARKASEQADRFDRAFDGESTDSVALKDERSSETEVVRT